MSSTQEQAPGGGADFSQATGPRFEIAPQRCGTHGSSQPQSALDLQKSPRQVGAVERGG